VPLLWGGLQWICPSHLCQRLFRFVLRAHHVRPPCGQPLNGRPGPGMAVSCRPGPVNAGPAAYRLYSSSVCDDSVLEMIVTSWQYAVQIHFHSFIHSFHPKFLTYRNHTSNTLLASSSTSSSSSLGRWKTRAKCWRFSASVWRTDNIRRFTLSAAEQNRKASKFISHTTIQWLQHHPLHCPVQQMYLPPHLSPSSII